MGSRSSNLAATSTQTESSLPKRESVFVNRAAMSESVAITISLPSFFSAFNWKILTSFSILFLVQLMPFLFEQHLKCRPPQSILIVDMDQVERGCDSVLHYYLGTIKSVLTLFNIVLVLIPVLALRTQRKFLMKLKSPEFEYLSDADKIQLFHEHPSIYSVILVGHLLVNLLLGSLAVGSIVYCLWLLQERLDAKLWSGTFGCNKESPSDQRIRCWSNLIHLIFFIMAGYLVLLLFNLALVVRYILYIGYPPALKTRAEAVLEFFGKGLQKSIE